MPDENSFPWRDDRAITFNPEQEVMAKLLCDLTIDEAITYRAAEFFPYSDDKRDRQIKGRVDGACLRSLNIITRSHPKTLRCNNQYIALCLGNWKISAQYAEPIAAIIKRYDDIESGTDDYLYARAQKQASIEQAGLLTQRQIGVTANQQDKILRLAEKLGITEAGFMVVCCWAGLTTSRHLTEPLQEYGRKIDVQFSNLLKAREYELKFTL